jgi:CheY-like chemotaxis protein
VPAIFDSLPTACSQEILKMARLLRVLIVEDSEDDALLLLRDLRRGSYDVSYERVDTADVMSTAIDQREWDIVISAYSMPHFDGLSALAARGESVPKARFVKEKDGAEVRE